MEIFNLDIKIRSHIKDLYNTILKNEYESIFIDTVKFVIYDITDLDNKIVQHNNYINRLLFDKKFLIYKISFYEILYIESNKNIIYYKMKNYLDSFLYDKNDYIIFNCPCKIYYNKHLSEKKCLKCVTNKANNLIKENKFMNKSLTCNSTDKQFRILLKKLCHFEFETYDKKIYNLLINNIKNKNINLETFDKLSKKLNLKLGNDIYKYYKLFKNYNFILDIKTKSKLDIMTMFEKCSKVFKILYINEPRRKYSLNIYYILDKILTYYNIDTSEIKYKIPKNTVKMDFIWDQISNYLEFE